MRFQRDAVRRWILLVLVAPDRMGASSPALPQPQGASRRRGDLGRQLQKLHRNRRSRPDRVRDPARRLFATPVERRNFDSVGTVVTTHGDYPAAMRALAQGSEVALLDIQALSVQLWQ